MHHSFLQDLAVVMIVAAIVTVLFRMLKQPVVLGYILAGVIIGPHTPPYALISDQHTIHIFSELGVIFLMFSLGLEFSLKKLKEVGATAFIAASLEILVMVWAGYQLGRMFGWGMMNSVFLGAILSISSTTIIIKALEEQGKTKAGFAQIIFGILIVEDILAIVLIALLSGFATAGTLSAGDVALTVLKLSAFLGVLLVAGLIIVPRLLNFVAKFKSSEMLLVTVIGLCFGVSMLAVKMEYSVALGAFLIGAIIAEARQIAKIEALVHPVKDLFSAVFFVSIGLLIDPVLLWKYATPILIITLVVVVGKIVSCTLGALISGKDRRTSLRVGMGLAQIGEFSFIIATLGLQLKVTSDFLYPIAVAVSSLTTLLTPYLLKASDKCAALFEKVAPAPLISGLDAYTSWIGKLGSGGTGKAGKLVRKMFLQIGLNVLLIAGIFIAAAALKKTAAISWPNVPGGENGLRTMLWFGAMLLSLPLLVASVRKLNALSMFIAEMAVSRAAAGESTNAQRNVVSGTIMLAGCLVILLILLLLSTAILPSWNSLIVAGLMLIGVAFMFRRLFIRTYAGAQVALRDTLAEPPDKIADDIGAISPILKGAELRNCVIQASSSAAGKVLASLKLRTKTGASIVGIEREDGNLINPGPDEEIRVGDIILLLGSKDQIEAAEKMMVG